MREKKRRRKTARKRAAFKKKQKKRRARAASPARSGAGGRGGQSRGRGFEALRSRPHADALVSDPRPILHRGGLINSPDASVDTLAACGRVRSAGDLPLAGFVGEAVSDLEVHREDVVGEKSDLPPVVLGLANCAEGRCLPNGVPERVERSFSLSQPHVRSIAQLVALLHQASRRLARRLRPASYFHWKHRAAVQVRPDAVGQVRVTPWAPV